MSNYSFKHIIPSSDDWITIETYDECTCFHTHNWCMYADRIGYKSYVVKIYVDQSNLLGYFIGSRIWRGVWMLVAPFEGTGTYTQGLVLDSSYHTCEATRIDIYSQLSMWAFRNNIASYFQVDDWQMRRDSASWIPYKDFHHDILDKIGIPYTFRPTLYLDMKGKTESELWKLQHYKSCKYSVNKARKCGLYIKRITDAQELAFFIDEHYNQLKEVCAKNGMNPKPSQSKDRMFALCESLLPDRVILLECIGPVFEGTKKDVIMSTGIFCPGRNESVYWTGASYQRYQKFCPNELMVWEAIRLLQKDGTCGLNFGGMANYKLKFGTIYAYVPSIHFSKYKWVYVVKMFFKTSYFRIRKLFSIIRGSKSFK